MKFITKSNPTGLTRRQFGRGAGVLGATLLLPVGSGVFAATQGGTLKLGLSGGSTSDTMDPMKGTDRVAQNLCYATYDTLSEISPDGTLIPSLAESWETNADATDWVFNIRQGVEFHDGKSLTAEDVAETINRHIGPDTASPMKALLGIIDEVVVETPQQVRIKLSSGNADLPYYFEDYRMSITPAGFDDWANPVGAGAYRMTSFDPGVSARGERNPNYWKEGRAHVDAYELTVISDTTARMNALATGAVHVINGVDAKTAEFLNGSGRANVVVSPGKNHLTMAMNSSLAPFNNNDVRLALKHSVDRDQIVALAFAGYGSVGNDHPVAKTDPFFHSELPQTAYDPDKAKFHLSKAGMDSVSVELFASTAAGGQAVDAAQIFAESAGQIDGMDVSINRAPADGYWSNVWMQQPFFASYWTARATADMILSYTYASTAKYNESRFKDEQFDQILNAARQEPDFQKRKQMYWDAQEILNQTGGSIVYAFADYIDAHAPDVGGLVPDSARETAGARVIERVWLDS